MFGEDPFGPLFTPSPFKGSFSPGLVSPVSEIGLRSPISMPCPFEETAAAAKSDQLSFSDILANYEQMELSMKQNPVTKPVAHFEQRISRKSRPLTDAAVFKPFVSLESVEMTVHQLRSLHHASQ